MTRTCKACKSDRLEWIDQQIRAGQSAYYVSNKLQDMGVRIASSSIDRHKINCLGISRIKDLPPRPLRNKGDGSDSTTAQARPPLLDDPQAVLADIKRQVGDSKVTAALLRDLAHEQLLIVKAGQAAYRKGIGPSPTDDIRSLAVLQGLLRDEVVISTVQVPKDATLLQKAEAITAGVINGEISPSNGERLLNVLAKQLELDEYRRLTEQLESFTEQLQR